jgi:hypothetical protein
MSDLQDTLPGKVRERCFDPGLPAANRNGGGNQVIRPGHLVIEQFEKEAQERRKEAAEKEMGREKSFIAVLHELSKRGK